MKTFADLGGWTGLSNLQLYLRASGFERSELAEGMAFFKGEGDFAMDHNFFRQDLFPQ